MRNLEAAIDAIGDERKGITADISLESERLDKPQGVEFFLWLPAKDFTPPSYEQLLVGAKTIRALVERGLGLLSRRLLAAADHVVKLRPQRSPKGDVITRARIWLTPEAEPAEGEERICAQTEFIRERSAGGSRPAAA